VSSSFSPTSVALLDALLKILAKRLSGLRFSSTLSGLVDSCRDLALVSLSLAVKELVFLLLLALLDLVFFDAII
jgi:hypothetical protein